MLKKYGLLFVVFLLIPHSMLFAELSFDSLTSSLSDDNKNTLLEGNALTSITSKRDKERLSFTPNINLFQVANNFTKYKKPQILYENLFFLEEPDEEKRKQLFIIVANQLLNVPILSTIEYQNLKDGNVHPLFESSSIIVSPTDETIITPELLLTNYPDAQTRKKIYVKQDMPPFGYVKSNYRYSYNKSYFEFVGNNITPISYNNIRAVKVRDMYTSCWVFNTDKGILIYGIGSVRISGIAVMLGDIISNSFTSRMVGLFTWLNQQIK